MSLDIHKCTVGMIGILIALVTVTSAQKHTPVTQKQGESIINILVEKITKKYSLNAPTGLIKLYYCVDSPSGVIVLYRSTELTHDREHGCPSLLVFTENILSIGVDFARTDDPSIALANFPAQFKYRNKLIELMKHPNAAVRVGVLSILTRMPDTVLIPNLEKSLKDDNLDVRLAAIIAFGSTETDAQIAFMQKSPENLARVQRSIELNQPFTFPDHPYRNRQVEAILTDYLNSSIRISDMPAILNTLVRLQMRAPIRAKDQIHAPDSLGEAFYQQCFQALNKLP